MRSIEQLNQLSQKAHAMVSANATGAKKLSKEAKKAIAALNEQVLIARRVESDLIAGHRTDYHNGTITEAECQYLVKKANTKATEDIAQLTLQIQSLGIPSYTEAMAGTMKAFLADSIESVFKVAGKFFNPIVEGGRRGWKTGKTEAMADVGTLKAKGFGNL